MPSGFNLSKWYLDCISDAGDVFVGYAARLSWNKVNLHYSATLQLSSGTLLSSTSWKKSSFPDADGDRVEWTQPDFHGTWTASCQPFQTHLLKSSDGDLHWNCLQPRSQATLEFSSGHVIKGWGYAEILDMTIPPWKLGIDELRWGRFNSTSDSIVWIDWRGPRKLSLVVRNGIRVQDSNMPAITDHGIETSEFSLTFGDRSVLRQGRLSNTALLGLPAIRNLFPAGILATDECKWLGRADLSSQKAINNSGWAIFEVVRFT